MPNWTNNTLTVTGDKKSLKAFKRRISGENGVVDFNSVVPMPKHGETFYADGPFGDEERKKYSENNWYDWSRKHWGTKWNACESSVEDGDDHMTFFFDTAWDAPRPLVEPIVNLAHKLGLTVVWDCDHEDGGYEGMHDDEKDRAA